MPFRIEPVKLDKSAGLFRRALQYAFYDWTREMPTSRRVITYVGIVLQGYAVYSMLMWAFMLPKWWVSIFWHYRKDRSAMCRRSWFIASASASKMEC